MTIPHHALPAADVAAGLGAVLSVWAHPDDEAYLAGGLLAAASDAGARVVCVTATRGEEGGDAAVREAELAAALAVLGLGDHRQWEYADGRCHEAPAAEAARRIADVIAEVRPDTVLTFGPDGLTGHSDHQAVSRWTTAAVRASAPGRRPRLLYAAKTAEWCGRFEALNTALGVFESGLPVPVSAGEDVVEASVEGELMDRKFAALCAHASQVRRLVDTVGEATYRSWIAAECFRRGV